MVRKFGKRNVTDVVGFKMPEQVDQIGRPVRHMAWPFVIDLRELTEKNPAPFWSVRANLQLAFETAEENPQRSLGFYE